MLRVSGDPNWYRCATGVAASTAGNIIIDAPGLVLAIPASATTISVDLVDDSVTISKPGTATARTLSGAVASGATSIPVSAGTGTIVVGEVVQFAGHETYHEVTGPGAIGAIALNTGAGSITISPGAPAALASGLTLTNRGHRVEVDSLVCIGDDTGSGITINGTIYHSRTVSSGITCRGGLTVAATGRLDIGSASDRVPQGVAATIRTNCSNALADNKFVFSKAANGTIRMAGASRTRRTRLTAALAAAGTTIQVEEATGWQVGDRLVLAFTSTQSTSVGQLQAVTIAAGYTPGSLTVPISAGSAFARAIGCRVINRTSNVTITDYSLTNCSIVLFNTDNPADGVLIDNVAFDLVGADFQPAMTIGSTPLAGGFRFRVTNTAVSFRGASRWSSFTGSAGALFDGLVTYSVSLNGGGLVHNATTVRNSTSMLNGIFAFNSGVNGNNPTPIGDISNFDCFALPGAFSGLSSFLCTGSIRGFSLAGGISGSGDSRVTQYAPGLVIQESDFAPIADSRTMLSYVVNQNGTTFYKTSQLPDQLPNYTFGNFIGSYTHFQFCWRRSTPATIINELWTNGGIARQVSTPLKNSSRSWAFETRAANTLIDHSFVWPIAAGETKTLKVNLRRDTTYGAGSMPVVTMRLPSGVTSSTSATDTANVWHEQTITITNSGAATEVTVTLATTGPGVNGVAHFAGLPVQPYIPAARWYGFVFDEANPFRVVDPTISLTEAASGAVTGVAINHTTSTITITAARTAAEVYCFCMLDLVNNLDASGNYRTRHITSSDGASFATTYTVVIGGGGSISGRYSDVNGSVVGASITNIVAGSSVWMKRTDTNADLIYQVVGGTFVSFNIQTAAAIPIAVEIRKGDTHQSWSTTGVIDPTSGFTVAAQQLGA
jgi:hypothetical protein